MRQKNAVEISDYKDNSRDPSDEVKDPQNLGRNQEFHYSGSFGLPAGQSSVMIDNMQDQKVTFDDKIYNNLLA